MHRDVRPWRREPADANLPSMKRENVHLGDRVQLRLPASRPGLLRSQLVRVDGTVVGLDEPGRPGVRVALDHAVSGVTTCCTTCGELRPGSPGPADPGRGLRAISRSDEVVFLTTRAACEPHYVDDRTYFELDSFYDEFTRGHAERRLPTRRETPRGGPRRVPAVGSSATADGATSPRTR